MLFKTIEIKDSPDKIKRRKTIGLVCVKKSWDRIPIIKHSSNISNGCFFIEVHLCVFMKCFGFAQPNIVDILQFNITTFSIRVVTLSKVEVSDDKDNKYFISKYHQ